MIGPLVTGKSTVRWGTGGLVWTKGCDGVSRGGKSTLLPLCLPTPDRDHQSDLDSVSESQCSCSPGRDDGDRVKIRRKEDGSGCGWVTSSVIRTLPFEGLQGCRLDNTRGLGVPVEPLSTRMTGSLLLREGNSHD